jgi:uncharacterized membrane protein (UPF0127 family)
VLRNQRTGAIVADRLLAALDSRSRRTGLLKHTGLALGEAMVIAPTNAIHTFFMRFAIDVAFVDRTGRVVKICAAVKPWKIAWAWGGYAVLETAANALDGLRPGDVLSLTTADTGE